MKRIFKLIALTAVAVSLTASCSKLAGTSETSKTKCSTSQPKLNSADQYAARGSEALNAGNADCAIDDCEAALKLDARNVTALVCRGMAHTRRDEYDLAQKDLDEALRIAPDNIIAIYNRSQAFRKMGQPDRALTDLNRLIEMSPEYYYYSDRAEVYSAMGKYDEALRDHAEAIRLKPGRGELYAKRALTYRRMNKSDLAEADERKVRELTASTNEKADAEEVINEKAINLPKPAYPAAARAVRASGQVRVRVETDAKGVVTSATAVSGHPLLKAAAESAARQTKFKEPLIKGILVFDFSAA